jgi:lipoyl(octanoyl) transferase
MASFLVVCIITLLWIGCDAAAWCCHYNTIKQHPVSSAAAAARGSSTTTRRTELFLGLQQLGSFEPLQLQTPDNSETEQRQQRRVLLKDLSNQPPIDFETAWDWQKTCLNQQLQRLSDAAEHSSSSSPVAESSSQFLPPDNNPTTTDTTSTAGVDTIYMLQHSPVYTLGTGSDETFVLAALNNNNDQANAKAKVVPTIRMDRGGEVTYHGPGQLVIYPILDLRAYKQDIHWYMRALEEAVLIAIALATSCGGLPAPANPNNKYQAERLEDITGIWIDNHKVAAVGIKCRKWVSMHGVAVNVEATSLDNFGGIVPCGLQGRKVGCINQFLGADKQLTTAEFAVYMKQALEQVFQIELID